MAPNDESSRVPFKWEEAPGKPIPAAHTSPCAPDPTAFNSPPPTTFLQLPPKLQFPLYQAPLSLPHSPCERPLHRLHRHIPSTHSPSPDYNKFKRLYTHMLKPASWSHPFIHPSPSPSPSWSSSSASDSNNNQLTINERFFFNKALPKRFHYSISMPDSWKAQVPLQKDYEQQDTHVNGKAQFNGLDLEEHEADTDGPSPWNPVVLHGRHGSACSWQPSELGVDDDDEDEGFHDFSSTASSSLEKPSQRSDNSMVSMETSSSTWFLDFSPEELGVHDGKERSKLVVRLVAIVNIKKIISSKVSKLRKRGADQQGTMWSPTLATYLFNEQQEEREGMSTRSKKDKEDNDDEDDTDESPSTDRSPSSHTFRINPDYHPPSLILRAHLQSNDDFFERSERSSSFKLQLSEENHDEDEKEEEQQEEGLQTFRHRLSLREQLDEFGDEYLLQFVPKDQSLTTSILDPQRGEPSPCKGICKVRNTVKVLVTTIKLILVQTEVKKRKGGQRPSRKYGGCFKPTIGTLSPFSWTHNQALS